MTTTTGCTDGRAHFSMRLVPVLSQGQITEKLATAEHLWAHIKVYQDGGENALHSHPTEDHLFFVLSGQAMFEDGDATEMLVGALEGIMLPAGVTYRFRVTGGENLVMLRVGASAAGGGTAPGRLSTAILDRRAPDGTLTDGSEKNAGTPALPTIRSGETFDLLARTCVEADPGI